MLKFIPRPLRTVLTITLLAIALILIADRVDEYRVYQGATIAAYLIAIISIVLLTGYSGQVSLGHGALMAVGGYSAALVVQNLHWPLWISFFVAVLGAAAVGAILGIAAARLSGPYLAGTTLAFAVGLPSIANRFTVLGGEQGIGYDVGMPPTRFGDSFTQYKWLFWICAAAALIAVGVAIHISKSKYGRIWRAVRADESAAALAGINIARSKVLVFTISAGFAGLAGALFSTTVFLVAPASFSLGLSFLILTGAVIGGIRSIYGAIIGAFVLIIIPILAETLSSGASESVSTNLPSVITGALLVLTVLLSPGGTAATVEHLTHAISAKFRR